MRRNTAATIGLSAIGLAALTAHGQPAGDSMREPLSSEAAAQLSRNVNHPVIVVMKNRLAGAQAAVDQAPLMAELHQVGAVRIKPYRLVNAFAATVSDGEVARLRVNPAVAAVADDAVMHHAPRPFTAASTRAALNGTTAPPLNYIPRSCSPDGRVQLNPEALLTTNTDSDSPKAKTARALGYTGKGVKVAWIADGVDPQNANFIRPFGGSVFFDYQDFSGDGAGRPTGGGEAFLDSNSIAGQGIVTYNVNGYSVQGLPSACNIRIEGVAPGASLLGLNVFGENEDTLTSNFLEAIDYAVFTDHVDVLNESYGGNGIPDTTSLDVNKLFNDAAVAAGVTVTVSSGDAGPTNTIGSPSSDPLVISAGATTTFRIYAQINEAAVRYFATTGWLDDNISALSSGGYTQSGRTVDLVAPGDLNWVSCDASPLYADCTNLFGQPSSFEDSGGTSESAPLTAGAAALVIEAYRNAHGGASPTPALVKQILTSSTSTLDVPATEQGTGILNTYNAVLLAQSVKTGDGAPAPSGSTLLFSQDQLNAIGAPGTPETWPVTVTNTGAAAQTVSLAGKAVGPDQNVQTGSVTLQDGVNPQFTSFTGVQENYATITFQVPAGADRLSAAIAFPPSNPPGKVVSLTLVDPRGRAAAYTLPQGLGDYGQVDVRKPVAGTWTGIIFSRIKAIGGVNGTVPYRIATQKLVPFGSVSPASLSLSPGQSQTVQVHATTPASPGDSAGSVVLSASGAGRDPYLGQEQRSIAVTLRSLVDVAHGGAFTGVLTGGNGRGGVPGQVSYYAFKVPAGTSTITANVSLTNDFADVVGAYLVNPQGIAVGFGQNTGTGGSGQSLTANAASPIPGVWTLIVDFTQPVVGDQISQPFTGNIVLNQIAATASGLPDSSSDMLAAGVPVTVPVTVTNNGAAPESVFVDARLATPASVVLTEQAPPASKKGYQLPLQPGAPTPQWLLPTQTSSVTVTASATLPIEFDYGPFNGDPDLFGAPGAGNTASGSYTPGAGLLQQGFWYANPDEIGPYPRPAHKGFANAAMTVVTKPFDPAVTSPTSDLWLLSIGQLTSFSPVLLNPGQSTTVSVTITPSAAPGAVVSGALYVDSYLGDVPPGIPEGNELAVLPYRYTVGSGAEALAQAGGHREAR